MRIRRRGISKAQIVIVSIIGVIGGIYIWKPVFESPTVKPQQTISSETEGVR